MPSPIRPSEVCALVPTGTSSLCDRILKVFLQLPAKFCALMTYMFNEDGTLTDAFKDDAQIVPTGMVLCRMTTVVPNGWLACDGQEVPRATYPLLFTTIGTTFGAGNGTTTFNVPNLKRRTLMGYDPADPTNFGVGATGGEETHTLQTVELPVVSNPNNVQGVIDTVTNVGAAVTSGGAIQRYVASALPDSGRLGQAFTNMGPYLAGRFMIKT